MEQVPQAVESDAADAEYEPPPLVVVGKVDELTRSQVGGSLDEASSDSRLKQEIRPVADALARLRALAA